jgi:hypothetical protein
MNTFNLKIGYTVPKVLLNSLIEEVVSMLEGENKDYLTMFKSFNNLEKVAIYFILMLKSDRTTEEIFNIINSNYTTLSKRDIMIKLLSEYNIEKSTQVVIDPTNGLFKLINTTPTHTTQTAPDFKFDTDTIEFKEFTFPMHNYNISKRFG